MIADIWITEIVAETSIIITLEKKVLNFPCEIYFV